MLLIRQQLFVISWTVLLQYIESQEKCNNTVSITMQIIILCEFHAVVGGQFNMKF